MAFCLLEQENMDMKMEIERVDDRLTTVEELKPGEVFEVGGFFYLRAIADGSTVKLTHNEFTISAVKLDSGTMTCCRTGMLVVRKKAVLQIKE